MRIQKLSAILLLVTGALSSTPSWVYGTPDIPQPQPAAAPNAMRVWTEHIAYKVQPTTAAGSKIDIQLQGARRSTEAAQIIVHASGEPLANVNLAATDLSDGAGHIIATSNITFFRQYFIDFADVEEPVPGNQPVPENSLTHDSRLPDPLIPFTDPYTGNPAGAPFSVAAELNQPIWVDVAIPTDTVAGIYTGQITVSAAGQPDVYVPVTLTVWDIVLPDMNVVKTHFGGHWENVIYYHRDTYDCNQADCWIDWEPYSRLIAKRYEELAHAHRIDTGQYFISEPGGCAPPSDWSEYDAAMQPYMEGSYWSDGVPSGRLDTPFTPGADWGVQTACTQAEYTALAQAWAAHLKAKDWFSRAVVYALDEPEPDYYDDIALHSAWMQAGDPDWKGHIMDTVPPKPSNVDTLNPALGIYTVCLRCYDHWYDNADYYGRAEWEWPNLFYQGIQLWFYESNAQRAPYPTFATNTLLGAEPRIMLWGSWYERATGFLLWDTVAWDRDSSTGGPWGPNVDFEKTGDGVLIYPGHHDGIDTPQGSPVEIAIDGPIPSYRLKVIRAGLQDWALFTLADQYGLADDARAQLTRVYSQMGSCEWSGSECAPVNGEFFWLTDPTLMEEIRHAIAQKIMEKQAPSPPSSLHVWD